MLRYSRAELSVLLLVFSLALTVWALTLQSQRAADDVIDRAFSSAEDLVTFVTTAQRHYIDMVSRVPVENMTPDPERDPDKIWLPATFARSYIDSYSILNPQVNFRLYSRDPFVYSQDRILDQFAEDALDVLLPGDFPVYRAVEEMEDGYRQVRLAAAFRMDENCVACHNRPEWGLANQNWAVGDVRGIWEASIVVPPNTLFSQGEFVGLALFVGVAFCLGAFVVWPAVRTEVTAREYFRDRSLAMEQHAELSAKEAETDALTGLGNRRYFDDVLPEMISKCRSDNTTLYMAMCDIDHFKAVNDTFGHSAGDMVIKKLAEILSVRTRAEDKTARIGGEEFVLLMPGLQPDQAVEVMTRLKKTFEAATFSEGSDQFSATMSAGCACLKTGEEIKDFLKRADDLLYDAKRTGRNKVCYDFDASLQAIPV